jgi:hypothetical protein
MALNFRTVFDSQGETPMNEIVLFAHPTCGVLGIMAALWVVVETLNASETNKWRLQLAAVVCMASIVAAWIIGGYWYVNFYAADKAVILKGPWPWAHNLFMETKEHLFFIPLILALFLPIAAMQKLTAQRGARLVVLTVAGLIVLNGLVIEGAGAVISNGVKMALMPSGQKGAD